MLLLPLTQRHKAFLLALHPAPDHPSSGPTRTLGSADAWQCCGWQGLHFLFAMASVALHNSHMRDMHCLLVRDTCSEEFEVLYLNHWSFARALPERIDCHCH